MKERPILFNAEMVRSILGGRKTQTRRILKPQPGPGCTYGINGAQSAACYYAGEFGDKVDSNTVWVPPTPTSKDHLLPCPYGQPGNRLWVRETWMPWIRSSSSGIRYKAGGDDKRTTGTDFEHLYELIKRTGGDLRYTYGNWGDPHPDEVRQRTDWRPSIHMPRWASRINPEVTRVRVERVQDISEEDAKAEGATPENADVNIMGGAYQNGFFNLWDSINAKRGYSWDSNPLVWVVDFEYKSV